MYESNVLLMVHGDDFRFNMIEEWHQHHDNFLPLFEEINRNGLAEIRFGTFSDYFTALEKWYADNGKQPATLSGDFFPYKPGTPLQRGLNKSVEISVQHNITWRPVQPYTKPDRFAAVLVDGSHFLVIFFCEWCALGDIWSGYFSTRPFIKRRERSVHNIIRAAGIVAAQARSEMSVEQENEVKDKLQRARRILSLIQHHDAITGTSRRHVMADYSILLYNASSLARSAFELASTSIAGSNVYTVRLKYWTLPLALSKKFCFSSNFLQKK
ncbi:hypothetical protein Y032_0069g299 [Ancylostoma ceylanicum]|nr:hypothetical protein Y032_0069g299 [Ancylostoma ceylanicum]